MIMVNKKFDISDRIGERSSTTDLVVYSNGVLDVVDFLFTELGALLTDEKRYFGIMKSYMTSVSDTFSKINDGVTEEDVEIFGKILYLLKPVLRNEYNRLVKKKLSPADTDICIIRKILGILEENQNYVFKKEVKTLRKVIDKMYDNIRNHAKKDSMFDLANIIRDCMTNRTLGKYQLDKFSFTDEYSLSAMFPEINKTVENNNQVFVKNLL